jgi:hypothetical protein
MHTGYTSEEYGVDKSVKDEDEEEEMMATWIMDGLFYFCYFF